MARFMNIVETDRIMVFLPLFHTNPQLYGVMSALETGCSIVIRSRITVSTFFQDARRFDCKMFTSVGTVLSMLPRRLKPPCRDHVLPSCAGAGCPPTPWRRLPPWFGIGPNELIGLQ